MNEVINHFLEDRAALPLPKIAKTRGKVEFDPSASHWAFREGNVRISLNFNLLPESCSSLVLGLKKTLIWCLENRSARTADNGFTSFLAIMRVLASDRKGQIQRVTQQDILFVKMSSEKAERSLARGRGFLSRWVTLGAPGIDRDLNGFLRRLKLKKSPVGVAVATLDPRKGPLTDLEFEAIQSALNDAYARDEISPEKLLLCYLLMSLGVRPVQLASLKCGDLIVPPTPDGDYILNVPRARQRGELDRSEFKVRKLALQIGKPLEVYLDSIRAEFAGRLVDASNAPMFPQRQQADKANAPGLEFHETANSISRTVIKLFASLGVPSERLEGQAIPVSPVRFRRTFATRAAEEGWPLLVLAELMDHSNTRNVGVYVGLTTRIRASFSRKIATDMAPLAQAFNGKIIRGEGSATRPVPASRIVDLRVDQSGAGMGSCGSHAHCGFARPIACYAGCHDFEPWLDGPHSSALDFMLARREHLLATADLRIAAINDRAILGCAQVMLRCSQIINGKEE